MKIAAHSITILFLILQHAVSGYASDQIRIKWDQNDEPDLQHYQVYRSTIPTLEPKTDAELIATTEATTYVDHNADPGNIYYYWIAAVDLYGNTSACSSPLIVMLDDSAGASTLVNDIPLFSVEHVDDDFYPDDPYVNRTLDNDNSIEFSWPATNAADAIYKIFTSVDQAQENFLAETEDNDYSISNAAAGTNYRLRIDVINANLQITSRGYSEVISCEPSFELLPKPGKPSIPELE
jgi:fibronectin type 3 domain-containing protein